MAHYRIKKHDYGCIQPVNYEIQRKSILGFWYKKEIYYDYEQAQMGLQQLLTRKKSVVVYEIKIK